MKSTAYYDPHYQTKPSYKEWLESKCLPEVIMLLKANKRLYTGTAKFRDGQWDHQPRGPATQGHLIPSVDEYESFGKKAWTLRLRGASDMEKFYVITRFSPTRWSVKFYPCDMARYPSKGHTMPARKEYPSMMLAVNAVIEEICAHDWSK